MGSVVFSDVILLKSYGRNMKHEKFGAIFTQNSGDNTVDLHVRTKVPAYIKKEDSIWEITCKLFVAKLP